MRAAGRRVSVIARTLRVDSHWAANAAVRRGLYERIEPLAELYRQWALSHLDARYSAVSRRLHSSATSEVRDVDALLDTITLHAGLAGLLPVPRIGSRQ